MNMKRVPRGVIVLGLVSFFTDLSSEMIYPLLPVFLSTVIGAGALALGVIEGLAESSAAFFKVYSGILTDRSRRRKPFILAGYGISGLVRPLISIAASWPFVMVMRFTDRIGKGLRSSPRDAFIADITSTGERGTAYGIHRAMDHAGAVLGPLVAAALLGFASLSFRQVFLMSAIPAVIVVLILFFYLEEPKHSTQKAAKPLPLRRHWKDLGANFKLLLFAILIFSLGNSTDAFLLLRLTDAGVPVAWVAVLWSLHHVVKMVATYFGGRLADVFGSRNLIVVGWVVYAFTYLAFALVDSSMALIAVFLAYGIYFGLTEPAEKSWVAELVPSHLRGTAFGYYHMVVGLGALPASVIFGFIWHSFGVAAAFATGAVLSALASIILVFIPSALEAIKVKELSSSKGVLPD
jgi:MFS family permease